MFLYFKHDKRFHLFRLFTQIAHRPKGVVQISAMFANPVAHFCFLVPVYASPEAAQVLTHRRRIYFVLLRLHTVSVLRNMVIVFILIIKVTVGLELRFIDHALVEFILRSEFLYLGLLGNTVLFELDLFLWLLCKTKHFICAIAVVSFRVDPNGFVH